jgi:hypothetical protein
MRTIVALALVLTASVANAAPIKPVCDGKITPMNDPKRTDTETRMITIDLSAKTVMLGGDVIPISDMNEETIMFASKGGPTWGSIHRFSGELNMHYPTATRSEDRKMLKLGTTIALVVAAAAATSDRANAAPIKLVCDGKMINGYVPSWC